MAKKAKPKDVHPSIIKTRMLGDIKDSVTDLDIRVISGQVRVYGKVGAYPDKEKVRRDVARILMNDPKMRTLRVFCQVTVDRKLKQQTTASKKPLVRRKRPL
jgi:alkylated DNA nucleotide flippase Atl1